MEFWVSTLSLRGRETEHVPVISVIKEMKFRVHNSTIGVDFKVRAGPILIKVTRLSLR